MLARVFSLFFADKNSLRYRVSGLNLLAPKQAKPNKNRQTLGVDAKNLIKNKTKNLKQRLVHFGGFFDAHQRQNARGDII